MRPRTKPNSVSEADGKGDLDFLEADGAEGLEHAHLLLGVHRLEKRLVAVTKVGAHPDWRLFDDAVRPVAVDKFYRGKSVVLGVRRLQHDGGSWAAGCIDWMNAILGKSGRQVLALYLSI
jgi:hypothetical protein